MTKSCLRFRGGFIYKICSTNGAESRLLHGIHRQVSGKSAPKLNIYPARLLSQNNETTKGP